MNDTNLPKTCLYCGDLFETKRKDAKYCSQRCKHRYHLEKKPDETFQNVFPEEENVSSTVSGESGKRFQNVPDLN